MAPDAKVALITGAGRGIGAAVARAASKAGYAVVVNYAHSENDANGLVIDIRAGGGEAIAVHGDISRESDVMGLFAAVDREYGRLDALVNNAGIARQGTAIADIGLERLYAVFAVNVFGTILCSREAVKRMSTQRGGRGGAIVNVSSIAAKTAGRPGETVHYGASKAAIDNFTIGLAREVAPEGIRVNAVCPVYVETPYILNSLKEKEMSPASPEKLTISTLPIEKSADTELLFIELKGFCPKKGLMF